MAKKITGKRENEDSAMEIKKHSLAHVLAFAVLELYPQAKLGMGPAIETGFYYDFDFSPAGVSLAPQDLGKIEKRMKEIIKKNVDFSKESTTITEAKRIFQNQPFKFEIIEDKESANEKKVNLYRTGQFVDLCLGPHVSKTSDLLPLAFRLQRLAGAYWKGNEKNPMLTRIYGVAFENEEQLKNYLKMEEEAEKRDHRVLGKKMDLFVFSDLVGKGLPLFTEKGSIIRRELERFIVSEEIKRGYKHVYTPDLAKVDLYRKSGHYPYYKDIMYPPMVVDEEELILRPMTCPHHYQLYLSRPRSYKELPYRIAELAKQFRYEKSGELTGLVRVRSFCLADAHIICQKEQAVKEIAGALDLIEYCAKALGLKKGKDFRYRLSLGNRADEKKYFKDAEAWDFAEDLLRSILNKRKALYFEADNEAAFYGPKIDIQMKNFLGHEETAFTVQYDFVAPKRFGLSYIDKDGEKKETVVIHRSSIGAIERVIAFLIEHYAGNLPLWLTPFQTAVLPIGRDHRKYAKTVEQILLKAGFRVQIMDQDESIGKKIREGEIQKIPYLLIVGDKEIKTNKVSVRKSGKKDLGAMSLKKFIEMVRVLIDAKK